MDLGRSTRYESSFIEENVDKGGNALPHEIEEGNVEYKLKLVDPPPERIEHLVTQLKWRLAEGHGEAMYEIGVADNGQLVGLSRRDMESSLKTLRQMGERLRADVSIIRERTVCPERVVAEVLVRKCLTDDQHFLEIRVAIIGGADAGKSTLLGVLTHSELDNGRGKSRLNLLRHRHEIESGRTSSISHQIIGFDPRGDLLNYGCSNITTWEQICETASKVITYLDLCGHPKYQKTTISGLTGHSPDYACLIIGANAGGVSEVPREHLGIAVALKVPVFIVITKIDVATPEDLSRTVTSLLNLLKSPGVRRVPMVIQNEDDLVVAVSSMASSSVIPIFLTSSVTGENLNLLVRFMNLLQKPTKHSETSLSDAVEFSVEETYTVPAVGCVVGGMLLSGSLSIHSGRKPIYFLGPDRGRFIPVKITSIHRQRCPVNHILSGQAATCSLNFLTQSDENGDDSQDFVSAYDPTSNEEESSIPPTYFRVRKGQVILPAGVGRPLSSVPSQIQAHSPAVPEDIHENAESVWEFEADLHVLSIGSKNVGLSAGSQGTLYLGSVRQGAKIVKL
ncbi:P-loop containing nucleoside triphosphate hydrolase protein, partial [Zopfochytrium polystomum]